MGGEEERQGTVDMISHSLISVLSFEINDKEPLLRRVTKFFKVHDRTPEGTSSTRIRRPRAPDQRIDLMHVCVSMCVYLLSSYKLYHRL